MKKTFLPILITFSVLSLCRAQQPVLWGLTSAGQQGGVIFNYNSGTDSENVVHDFGTGTDGSAPTGSLIKASNGLLYGMTQAGGAVNLGGILFSYNLATGQETDLHDFDGSDTDGYGPTGSLIQLSNGLLYGMTPSGGLHGGGVIFSYDISTGKLSDLYDFGFALDAAQPGGSLMQASDSMLYGMSFSGGDYNLGTIFRFDISNDSETIVWSFGNYPDGFRPNGSLIQATNGLLYGMTAGGGGATDTGIIFSFNISTDTEIVVHYFAGGNDGTSPMGSLKQASDTLLYGMTDAGGGNGGGIIFSYDAATGQENVLWNFGGDNDGIQPQGSLIQASNGLLYGMTVDGLGEAGGGTIFSYNFTTGTETVLHNFGISPGDGILPDGDLLEDDAVPQPLDLQCDGRDQHSVYLITQGGSLYRIDSVDSHPTAPITILSNDTSVADGISINKNLDSGSGDMTMYIVDTTDEYYYWNDSTWVDTHHQSGSTYALNPGGTNNYIFNIDPLNGILYRYDGSGNGSRLISVPTGYAAFPDVATDMNGNFYLYYYAESKVIAYNPDGIPLDTFFVTGGGGGGGFGIIGSKFYITEGSPPHQTLLEGSISNSSYINFAVIAKLPSAFSAIYDMATCPNAGAPLAVFEVPAAPHFIIYPNPASDKAIIKMDNTAHIDVYNPLGQKIFTAGTGVLTQYELSVSAWPRGVYFVSASSTGGIQAHTTLVVQ